MKKSGIEVAITGTVWDRPRLGINAGLNVSTNNSEVVSLGGAPAFSVGNFGWVIEGQPAPVLRGKIIRNPNAVGVAPDTSSNYAFGPSQPTQIIGGSLSIRTWRNIRISARGEYQGGAYINEDASYQAISRSVLWPTCFGAYAKQAAQQPLTVKETLMCVPANARQDMFIFKADFFKVRDITLTVPLGRVIPRSTSSSLVFSAQNIFRKNYGMPMFDPGDVGERRLQPHRALHLRAHPGASGVPDFPPRLVLRNTSNDHDDFRDDRSRRLVRVDAAASSRCCQRASSRSAIRAPSRPTRSRTRKRSPRW